MNDTYQIFYWYLWRYGFVSGTFTDAYPIRDSIEWRVFIEDVPIKCHSRDPAETDRRRHLSKSLRRNVKMTVRIIPFELGSVTKATHCRLFHVRHLSKTVLSSTILSSSSCPSLAKSDPFQIFKIDPPEVVNHFETEDIFLVTHSVLSEPVSSMKFINFQRKTKIFDILVIANVISRRISRHAQKMRCTDPKTHDSIDHKCLSLKISFVIIRSSGYMKK